ACSRSAPTRAARRPRARSDSAPARADPRFARTRRPSARARGAEAVPQPASGGQCIPAPRRYGEVAVSRSYWFLISLLAAIWGASYLFIKVAVRDFSPPAMMEIRLAFAALLLGGFLVASRGFREALADVRAAGWHGLALGVVNGAIPFTLIAWGEKHIDSGVAAIANSTVPIFNVMLAPMMLPSERTTGVRLFGFVLGLVGVGVLSGAQPDVTTMFVLGTMAVVLAS